MTATTLTIPASKRSSPLSAHVGAYLPLTYTDAAGRSIPYRLHVPSGAREGNNPDKYPLVLFLHGSGGCGDNNTGQLTDGVPTAVSLLVEEGVQQQHPCFVLAPQCPNKQTWGGVAIRDQTISVLDASSERLDLTLELLRSLLGAYPIDRSRLYVTGISLGGFGTWRAVAQAPDLFAAAVPVCGGAHDAIVPIVAKSGIPIWNFHGGCDPTVSPEFSRRIVTAIREAGGDVRYTEYSGVGHASWAMAYAEPRLLSWLFAQRRAPRD